MHNKKFFSIYTHISIYLLSAILYAYFLGIAATDDGLRHISFAKNSDVMISWGKVFPYSLFNQYDPWFGWHFLLNKFLILFTPNQIHFAINSIVLFILMVLIDKFLRVYVKYKLDSLIYILVLIIVLLSSFRYVIIRPDMLSGIFIMIAILLRNRFIPPFILTIIYAPFYYLFFLYTFSIAAVYLIQKKFRAFFAVAIGTLFSFAFFLIYDKNGYIDTVHNILIDQKLRMGLQVNEGKPIFDFLTNINYFILLPTFLMGAIFLIYKNYSYFKNNTLATFLLITSILWVNQYRYYQLFLPIIFVYVISLVFNMNKKKMFYILRKYQILLKRFFSYSKNKKLFYFVALPYSVLMLTYIYSDQSRTQKVENEKIFMEKRFDNKLILSNTMDTEMYSMLYYNPTIKLIPSCSIGWFNHENKELKKLYVDMINKKGINEEKLNELIRSVNADFYLHYTNRSKKTLDIEKLRGFGIIPKEIYKNKILFEVRK